MQSSSPDMPPDGPSLVPRPSAKRKTKTDLMLSGLIKGRRHGNQRSQ